MKGSLILFLGYAAAAVVPRVNDLPTRIAAARPGAIIGRQESSGTAKASRFSNSNSNSTTSTSGSVTTAAPTLPPTAPDGDAACIPATVCKDMVTMMDCGSGLARKRYGGCYDKNFCTATTSFPPPTCG